MGWVNKEYTSSKKSDLSGYQIHTKGKASCFSSVINQTNTKTNFNRYIWLTLFMTKDVK